MKLPVMASCLALLLSVLVWQCGKKTTDNKKNDPVLAKVYNKTLYQSELDGVVPESTSPEDSLLLMQAFTQRWIRDQLLMYEAERNIPKDLNIDELVRNYRASLVRFNYEEQIISEQMDSTVSEQEIRTFYENNQDQFQLESTILKCLLIKIPADAPQNELNKFWYSRKKADEKKLVRFAGEYATLALLDPEKWYKIEELAALLPQGTLTAENASSRKEGTLSDGDFRYYYRVLEVVRGKETAPLDYVQEQASKIILHRRKQALLEKWKEDLYQKELRRENVKVY
ncbi:MAG: peptidylprolyl isomerase [Saprospiraceae bacterium]